MPVPSQSGLWYFISRLIYATPMQRISDDLVLFLIPQRDYKYPIQATFQWRNLKVWALPQDFENGPLLPIEILAVDKNRN